MPEVTSLVSCVTGITVKSPIPLYLGPHQLMYNKVGKLQSIGPSSALRSSQLTYKMFILLVPLTQLLSKGDSHPLLLTWGGEVLTEDNSKI